MTAPSERNVDGIAASVFDAAPVLPYEFMRLDLPAPNGIIRFTNHPQGYVGDIDGTGSQTWLHADLRLSSITWAQTNPEDVSWIELWNLDNVWSALLLNYDIEFKPIMLWQAWLNVATKALYGKPKLWDGRTESAQIQRGIVRLSIVPARSYLSAGAPWAVISPSCQHVFKDADSCQYAGIVKPASLTVSDGGAGAKGAGTYYYTVTALHGTEETDGVTGSVTIAASHRVSLSWPASTGATGYNVYGCASGDQKILLNPNGQNVQGTSFVDNVATASQTRGSGTPPVSNGTGAATDCDRSWGACANRGNRVHFGGFPLMNDKPIIWAQRQLG